MTTYAFPNIIRGNLQYTLAGGQQAFNVFHFGVVGGPPTPADVSDAVVHLTALATTTGAGNGLLPFLSVATGIVQAYARTLDPANPLEATNSLGVFGGDTGEPVPLESAIVTTLYTPLASRRGRGRTYLPGAGTGATANGVVSAGTVSALQTVYNQWLVEISNAGQLELVVFSPTNNSGQNVSECVTRAILHHQRRRNT